MNTPTISDKYNLPSQLESNFLRTISGLYHHQGHNELLAIIVNAQVQVEEAAHYDNWNGGLHGHVVHLHVPEAIFIQNVRKLPKFEQTICEDLNTAAKYDHSQDTEHFYSVSIHCLHDETQDWRVSSGALLGSSASNESPPGNPHVIPVEVESRIWEPNKYRIFLSHKVPFKKETAKLKEQLSYYGISCFVAHEDIHPAEEWQHEIENALNSMHALVALITDDFSDSPWTDQEVGYALGRGVPVIPVTLQTKDPYGFIGKIQALRSTWENQLLPSQVVALLLKKDQERVVDGLIQGMRDCPNFNMGNELADQLPIITNLSDIQIRKMIEIYDSNGEISGSFGFSGSSRHGYQGLHHHLNRITGKNYDF
ncbi:toll/interleukin-1 receptor domain-containing protein [Magnetococcus sp. PR-3]|uniref:toll/interleukin-1 receptor domain-containing protein n=1 Tax=Magnetococcus sp. PR-3 TaxID=3120355 RepID=UPI002FCDE870